MQTCLLTGVAVCLVAADKDTTFAHAWWLEGYSDARTVRLFHCGAPQGRAWAHLVDRGVEARTVAKDDKALLQGILDGTAGDDVGKDLIVDAKAQAEAARLAVPVGEPVVPDQRIFDYSDARATIDLPAGMEVHPEGCFGSGLRSDGSGPGLAILPAGQGVRDLSMLTCWIRISQLPTRPACIISAGGDESKLLLLPDGRLEVARAKPHGTANLKLFASRGEEAEYQAYIASDPTVRSTSTIPLNRWVHVGYGRGQTAVVNAHVVYLWINGTEEAIHQGCKYNEYNFLAGNSKSQAPQVIVGNNAAGNQPFVGDLDEIHLSRGQFDWGKPARFLIKPEEQTWIEGSSARELRLGKPWFLDEAQAFHLGLDQDLSFSWHRTGTKAASWDRPVADPAPLLTPGVRGQGMIIDPRVGLLQIPSDGLSLDQGSLEFWSRPWNWDDTVSLPILSVRGIDAAGKEHELFRFAPQRSHRLPPGEPSYHPGRWQHHTLTWRRITGAQGTQIIFHVYRDQQRSSAAPLHAQTVSAKQAGGSDLAQVRLSAIRIGCPDRSIGGSGLEPILVVDEIIGHAKALNRVDLVQAYRRAQGDLDRARLIETSLTYHRGRNALQVAIRPLLGDEQQASSQAIISIRDAKGKALCQDLPLTLKADGKSEPGEMADLQATMLLQDITLPEGPVQVHTTLVDAQGKALIAEDSIGMTYAREWWYQNSIGESTGVQAPWTAIEGDDRRIETLMTTYHLGDDGLPRRIVAKGQDLLHGPMIMTEDGIPMRSTGVIMGERHPGEVSWISRFSGRTCAVEIHNRVEFDGLLRQELRVSATAAMVAPLRLDLPLRRDQATHLGYQAMGTAHFEVRPTGDGFSSRDPVFKAAVTAAVRAKQKPPEENDWRGYAFLGQIDLGTRERGLHWFADNAKGWVQSDRLSAQEILTDGEVCLLRLNLIAEATSLSEPQEIVYGLLPHPARPVAVDHRLLNEAASPEDPRTNSLTGSVFLAIPASPKAGDMAMYPRNGSWEDAERAGESLRRMASGFRTMYTSMGYASCRAGSYDHADWRNMSGSRISLTDSMVDYLIAELDQWVGRDIYDAFYVDDSYNMPITGEAAVASGHAIRLPDGSIQAGMHLWQHRQLMKRWRQVMLDHGRRPMIMAHHTGTWMYPGFVFCEATLDGEGEPTITHRGKEATFVDYIATRQERFSVIQNPELWGVAKFYMPSIWGFGPQAKGESPHRAWAWRMARGAQALFAHQEVHSTFYDEDGGVFPAFWGRLKQWGALDPSVTFTPHHRSRGLIACDDDERSTWVSYYHKGPTILVIVSNLTREDRDIRLRPRLADLGLGPAPTIVVQDALLERPQGSDPYETMAANKTKADLDAQLQKRKAPSDDIDVFAELEAQEASGRAPASTGPAAPTWDGDVLVVPVRKQDYRVIALE